MADPKMEAWKKSASKQVDQLAKEFEKCVKEFEDWKKLRKTTEKKMSKIADDAAVKISFSGVTKEAEKEVR